MNKSKTLFRDFWKIIILIFILSSCICKDKWITVEGHFFRINNSEDISQSVVFYGNSDIPDSFDISPLPGAFFILNLDSDQPFEFDSLLIRGRSDSSGYLRITGAAPPGKYRIMIYAGKEGFYPAEIVVVDPPQNQDQIHQINVLLIPEDK